MRLLLALPSAVIERLKLVWQGPVLDVWKCLLLLLAFHLYSLLIRGEAADELILVCAHLSFIFRARA